MHLWYIVLSLQPHSSVKSFCGGLVFPVCIQSYTLISDTMCMDIIFLLGFLFLAPLPTYLLMWISQAGNTGIKTRWEAPYMFSGP